MTEQHFPKNPEDIVGTLIELLQHQSQRSLVEILEHSTARIEETDYDNWDGGTYYYTLFLDIPIKLFAKIEANLIEFEKKFVEKLKLVLRETGNQLLHRVVIQPITAKPTPSKVPPAEDDISRIWVGGSFRLFLSHKSKYKKSISDLKEELRTYGVSAFVAHEDIKPTLEWQDQIQIALGTMNALAALLTPDFRDSQWTDQEVGFALCKGVPIIPIRLGMDPYGFIGKYQALRGDLERAEILASKLIDTLLKNKRTSRLMQEALVQAFEKSESFNQSIRLSNMIIKMTGFTNEQIERMVRATKENRQVTDAFGVPEKIQSFT